MVFILVATEDAERGAHVREILSAQGWWVTVVTDREGALRAAADQEPEVVVIDGTGASAAELVRVFSSKNGGPGALVLSTPQGEHESFALVEAGADDMLSDSPPAQELVRAVERVAAIPHQSTEPSPLPIGRQLTAEEIFGDILSEVDSKADLVAAPPEQVTDPPSAEVEAKPVLAREMDPLAEAESAPEPEPPSAPTSGSGPDHEQEAEPEAQDEAQQIQVEIESGSVSEVLLPEGGTLSGRVVAPPALDELSGSVRVPRDDLDDDGEGLAHCSLPELEVTPTEATPTEMVSAEEGSTPVDENPSEETPVELTPVGLASIEEVPQPEIVELASEGEAEEQPRSRELVGGHDSETIDSDFGQYRLEERIAVGGMAEVWRASMVGLEGFRKTVAIKKILPHLAENEDFVAMFVDEAKLAAQLSHENLVDIYDLGKIDGDFFIAMEYVEGKDLRSILNRLRQRKESMPLSLAFFIAARTSAALDYVHTRLGSDGQPIGLVHRDVSPRNILISDNGNVRLCDFGVAKAVSSVARTEIGALKGKIQYMSPEQAAGVRVDGRSDVFSLGSVLFEMATGRRLFVEDTEITLLDAVRRGETDDPRSVRADLPEVVSVILSRALSKAAEERYQSAGEMQRELDEALFQLEPKPTQAELSEWMTEIFDDAVEPQFGPLVEAKSTNSPASAEPLVAEQGEIPRSEDAQPVRAVEMPEDSAVGLADETTNVMSDQNRGRRRFWLGVATGLVVAVLLALILSFWIDRRGGPVPLPPISDEPSSRSSVVDDGEAQADGQVESATADGESEVPTVDQ